MNHSEIILFLKETINEIAFTEVTEDESLFISKLIDSISFVDLLVAIEEKMNIKIKQNEVNTENFDTVHQITTFIENKLNEK
jgi:acyl carrier protein